MKLYCPKEGCEYKEEIYKWSSLNPLICPVHNIQLEHEIKGFPVSFKAEGDKKNK